MLGAAGAGEAVTKTTTRKEWSQLLAGKGRDFKPSGWIFLLSTDGGLYGVLPLNSTPQMQSTTAAFIQLLHKCGVKT